MSKEKGCKDRLLPEILTSSDLAHQHIHLFPQLLQKYLEEFFKK